MMITPEARLLMGVITAVDPVQYTCTVNFSDSIGVRPNVPLPIYYCNGSGWSRRIPQEGVSVLVAFRPTFQPEIIRYYPASVAHRASENYAKSIGLFRDLVPGEEDNMSSGSAGYWETIEGRFLATGGAALLELNRSDFEATLEAGTINLSIPQASDWCNVKFGTIKRQINGQKQIITKDGIQLGQGGTEMVEFSLSVGWDPAPYGSPTGQKLGQLSLGQVVDDTGTEETWSVSTLPIRARLRVFNVPNSYTTDLTVDEDGNMGIRTPLSATRGVLFQVEGGNLEAEINQGQLGVHAKGIQLRSDTLASITSLTNTSIGSDNTVSMIGKVSAEVMAPTVDIGATTVNMGGMTAMTLSSGGTTTVSGDTITTLVSKAKVLLNSPSIVLGESATLRLLLETFLDLYNSHTHAGVSSGNSETAPPSQLADSSYLTSVTVAT
jgi:hypothetical protein